MNPEFVKDSAETLRLGHRPRKTIEHESVAGGLSLQRFSDDPEYYLVRDEFSSIHEALRLPTPSRSFSAPVPQDVSGRVAGHTEETFENLSLRSLTRTGRAHQYNSHLNLYM